MFLGSEGHVTLDRNPGPGYNTVLLQLIQDLLSACPLRQFHTLPGLLDHRAALSNSNHNVCMQCREVVCTILMKMFGMTRLGRELTTYRVRGGHAYPKRYYFSIHLSQHSGFLKSPQLC